MYNHYIYSRKGLIIIFPVEKNKKYIVDIDAVSSEGSGIAKINGYTLFIPDTVDGDTAEILVVKTKSSYGYGKLINIITPSEKRTIPPCPHFSRCGGCQMMSMDYSHQLSFKQAIVCDALKRIGGINCHVDIIGMEEPFHYRNKMIFPIDQDSRWGFYRERSHDVIPLDDCLLGNKINKDIMNTICAYMRKFTISPYDEVAHKGIVRRVFIRNSGKEIMVVISANSSSLPHTEYLTKKLLSLSDKITSIILNVNKKRTNLVLGDENITLFGKDKIPATLCGLDYEISPHSFFQVNPIQTEKLYQKAIEYADISSEDTVMDIYCGIGTISLTAAKFAKNVIGVEIVPQAIEDARKNAIKNNFDNADFYCSAAEDIVPQLIKDGTTPDVVILDPPRKGSDEKTLLAIVSAQPKRIVYVSCNPATLARDVKFLSENGYTLTKATAVDMFPHTTHVECVVRLCRN